MKLKVEYKKEDDFRYHHFVVYGTDYTICMPHKVEIVLLDMVGWKFDSNNDYEVKVEYPR